MRCDTIQRWLLLETTGELSPRRHAQLQEHVADCDDCRAWRDSMAILTAGTRDALASAEPSQATLDNIRREARLRADDAPHQDHLAPWLRPAFALATAALCLIAIGGWWMRPEPTAFCGQAQLNTILRMLEEESTVIDQVAATVTIPADEPLSLDALAAELLTLQGLDETYTEAELREPGVEPPATAPLTHSTPAPPARIYV